MKVITLSIEQIKIDLKNGFTRSSKDKNYNPAIGSIEAKYGLSPGELTEVFAHPDLKGLRTTVPKSKIVFVEEQPQAQQSIVETLLEESEVANDTREVSTDDLQNADIRPIPSAWATMSPERGSYHSMGIDPIYNDLPGVGMSTTEVNLNEPETISQNTTELNDADAGSINSDEADSPSW